MQIYLNSFNQPKTTNNYSRQVKFGMNKQFQPLQQEAVKLSSDKIGSSFKKFFNKIFATRHLNYLIENCQNNENFLQQVEEAFRHGANPFLIDKFDKNAFDKTRDDYDLLEIYINVKKKSGKIPSKIQEKIEQQSQVQLEQLCNNRTASASDYPDRVKRELGRCGTLISEYTLMDIAKNLAEFHDDTDAIRDVVVKYRQLDDQGVFYTKAAKESGCGMYLSYGDYQRFYSPGDIRNVVLPIAAEYKHQKTVARLILMGAKEYAEDGKSYRDLAAGIYASNALEYFQQRSKSYVSSEVNNMIEDSHHYSHLNADFYQQCLSRFAVSWLEDYKNDIRHCNNKDDMGFFVYNRIQKPGMSKEEVEQMYKDKEIEREKHKDDFKGISTVLSLQRKGMFVPRDIALTYPSHYNFQGDEYRKVVCFENEAEVYVTYKWENPGPRFGYGGL